MTLSRRTTIKAIGVAGAGSALTGTALAINQDDVDDDDETDDDDDGGVGAIRVGHFSPDAPDVDVYIANQQVLSDVSYDELSPYLDIAPGTYTMTITEAGDEDPIYEDSITVDTDYYTVAAIGEYGDETAETASSIQEDEDEYDDDDDYGEDDDYDADDDPADEPEAEPEDDLEDDVEDEPEDDLDDDDDLEDEDDDLEDDDDLDDDLEDEDEITDDGEFEVRMLYDAGPDDVEEESQLRVFNASPNSPELDVTEEEDGYTIFENVAYAEPPGYAPIDSGSRTLQLFESGDDDLEADDDDEDFGDVIAQEDPLAAAEADLEEGTAYTVYVIGYFEEGDGDGATAEGDRPFEMRVAVDGGEEDVDGEPEEAEPDEEEVDDDEDDLEEDEPEDELDDDEELEDDPETDPETDPEEEPEAEPEEEPEADPEDDYADEDDPADGEEEPMPADD